MAWEFTPLLYGWKLALGITLASPDVYSTPNSRYLVNQADVIPPIIGTWERDEATCSGSNSWGATPGTFVRSWYSNSYVTTNVPGDAVTNWTAQLYTNVFTNVIGFRSDYSMMTETDIRLRAAIPFYFDRDTVLDGATNYSMLTESNVFSKNGVGDSTNKFTQIPQSGTNPAIFSDSWGGRIHITGLQERYKVNYELKKTFPESGVSALQYWHGVGIGTSFVDAVSAAGTNYQYVSDEPLDRPLSQHCKVMFFSNLYTHCIPGEYGCEGDFGSNYVHDLLSTRLRISVSGNSSNEISIATNLVVTGSSSPDVNGTYCETAPEGGYRKWTNELGMIYSDSSTDNRLLNTGSNRLWNGYSLADTYSKANSPVQVALTVGVSVYEGTTNLVIDDEYGIPNINGLYYEADGSEGYRHWSGNGVEIWVQSSGPLPWYGDIFYNDGTSTYNWSCSDATPGGTYNPYPIQEQSDQAYVAESLVYTTNNIVGPNPSGEYQTDTDFAYERATWQKDGWVAVYTNGTYYLTQSTNYGGTNLPSPAWTVDGESAGSYEGLTYSSIVGTGIWGVATGTYFDSYGGYYWTNLHDYVTSEVGQVFYQCWMTKVGWSNSVFVTTNIDYASEHYVFSATPSIADYNTFNAEDTGWESNKWNLAASGSSDGDTNEMALVGGSLANPPVAPSEPTNANSSTCTGLTVSDKHVLLDWAFQYCTNKWW